MSYSLTEAIKVAKSQVGKRESGNNDTPYNRWLGKIPGYPHSGYGYPWCMSFQAWVASKAGGKANVDYPKTAGCEVAVAWFKAHKRLTSTPHVGDMVFYGPGGGTHVELVVAVSSSAITTVGGNTSGSLNGAFHNGDGVYQKSVARSSSRIYGYGRPVYAAASQENDMDPKTTVDVGKTWDGEFDHGSYPAGYLWVESTARTRRIERQLAALAKKAGVDVDEGAIVAGVLAGLAPGVIADAVVDAMPPELAKQVLDGLKTRLEA